MDLARGDTVLIALSENGKVVDGIYNYFTVSFHNSTVKVIITLQLH